MEGDPAALAVVAETVARRGTTSLVATTVTASPDSTCQAAAGISAWMRSPENLPRDLTPRAEILGIHFEGPFINPARRGVHPLEWIAPPSIALFEQFRGAAQGAARILTLAPELPGALDVALAARAAGCVVSLGHTDATYAQTTAAVAAGVRHATHVFNAMRPFTHRDSGVVGAILASPLLSAELIADGVHVDEGAMRMLLAAKGCSKVILVSDGTSATGMPDGVYRLGNSDVTVRSGVPRSADSRLAGSTLTLDRALRNIVSLGVPLNQALVMLTENPSRLLGLEARKGVLAPGADADMVLLDEKLQVVGVMTRGVG
jgi:N-acetylglucosamine-6-phosphate deacetylase